VVGDFTGSGKLDIAVGTLTYLNSGNRTFQAGISSNLQMGEGALFAVGDFNGDGKADVAINLPGENWITIFTATAMERSMKGRSLIPARNPQCWWREHSTAMAKPISQLG